MTKIKYFGIIILLIIVMILAKPNHVSAHMLATNGSIGGILHMNPEDDPIIGQQARLFFEFKDRNGKFDPKNCSCTFAIVENGKEIYSQDLFQNSTNPSLDNASIVYTFPEKNVYTIKVSGKPYSNNSFSPFTLSWEIRVTREASQSNTQNSGTKTMLLIGIASIISIFVVGIIAFIFRRKK